MVAIAAVDISMVFLLIVHVSHKLMAAGMGSEIGGMTRESTVIYFVLLVFLSSMSLTPSLIYASAAVAAACEIALFTMNVPAIGVLISAVAATLMAATLGHSTIRRAKRLVHVAATEHGKRERLSRYFSPQIAARIEARAGDIGPPKRREFTAIGATPQPNDSYSRPRAWSYLRAAAGRKAGVDHTIGAASAGRTAPGVDRCFSRAAARASSLS